MNDTGIVWEKELRVLSIGVKPRTLQLALRMLYHGALEESFNKVHRDKLPAYYEDVMLMCNDDVKGDSEFMPGVVSEGACFFIQ